MRPVNRRRDTGIYRLDGGEQVPCIDVFRAEDLAPIQVVEVEVVSECPVGAIAAQRGLPHMAVRVDHAGHENTAAGINLDGAVRHSEFLANCSDVLIDDENVATVHQPDTWIDAHHDGVAEHYWTAWGEVIGDWCRILAHLAHL